MGSKCLKTYEKMYGTIITTEQVKENTKGLIY